MKHNRLWIKIGLVLWIVMAFAGRWSIVALVQESDVVIKKAENDFNGKETDRLSANGLTTFALAVHEMGYEGVESISNEKTDRDNISGNEGTVSRIAKEVRKKFFVSKNFRIVISAKRTIRYFVFGLCKMLN